MNKLKSEYQQRIDREAYELIYNDLMRAAKKYNTVVDTRKAKTVRVCGEYYSTEQELQEAYGAGIINSTSYEYGMGRLNGTSNMHKAEVNERAMNTLIEITKEIKEQYGIGEYGIGDEEK